MKSFKSALVSFAALSMLVLAGCTGAEGPMGPTGATGPAGPGTQTTYIFDVTPAAASGSFIGTVPPLETNSTLEDFSTTNCFIRIGTDTESYSLPFDDSTTGTSYFYAIDDGGAQIFWSGSTTPAAFEFIVTLVNN